MSAHIADPRLAFKLPSLSYIDAKWEEPNLRSPEAAARVVPKTGLAAWLSRQINAFAAWRADRQAALELRSMSDHELADIGLSRADLQRVFNRDFSQDLRLRGIVS
jgi:uncharacterized protein YjiS (DUF1127 family)